jgi:hypothetical protein
VRTGPRWRRATSPGVATPGQGCAGGRPPPGWPDRGLARGGLGRGARAGTDRGHSRGQTGMRAGEGGRRGDDRGREGELTSGLDDRWQPLTGIPPRARGGGREGEGSCCAGKENERERGVGARLGRVGPGQAVPRAGLARGLGRQPTARTLLPLIKFKS